MIRKIEKAETTHKDRMARVPVTIRLPQEIVKKIDLDLARRLIPVSRNNWLLEAALEKLQSNGSRRGNGKE